MISWRVKVHHNAQVILSLSVKFMIPSEESAFLEDDETESLEELL